LAIRAKAYRGDSPITITNSGELHAYSPGAGATGIYAFTAALLVPGSNPISIVNSGNITVSGSAGVGISGFAVGVGYDSPLHIENTGDIAATGDQFAAGILAENGGAGGAITVENHGDIFARANSSFSGRARGIYVDAQGGSPVSVVNSGNITAIGNDEYVTGISVETGPDSLVSIDNSGAVAVSGGSSTFGIFADTGVNSPTSIENSGDIAGTTSVGRAYGIFAIGRSPVSVENSGDIAVATSGPNYGFPAPNAIGIAAVTNFADFAPVSVVNSGDVNVSPTTPERSQFSRALVPITARSAW
jgi:hypothetical protein